MEPERLVRKDLLVGPLQKIFQMAARPAERLYPLVPSGRPREILRGACAASVSLLGKRIHTPEWRDSIFNLIYFALYDQQFRQGDTVVQVGASIGQETARLSAAVGAHGRVIAIEPEPNNFAALRERVAREHLSNVTPVHCGVWSHSGELKFLVGDGPRRHRIADLKGSHVAYDWYGQDLSLDPDGYVGTTAVQVDTLDNILQPYGLNRIDFMLIEVNGAELEAVKGLDALLPVISGMAIRGHVRIDGEPINRAIASRLRERGLTVTINREGMVLAKRA